VSTAVLDGVSPRSRGTDPVTSVDAGRDAQLTSSQEEVLWLFHEAANAGSAAFADHELVAFAQNRGSTYTPQRIRSARAELAEKGLLIHAEGDYCTSPTGKNARVWTLASKED
jgi:hypothetical protein